MTRAHPAGSDYELRAGAVREDKKRNPYGKPIGEIREAERAFVDGQQVTVACAFCAWQFAGSFGEARERAVAHRGIHPEVPKRPRKTMQARVERPERCSRAHCMRSASTNETGSWLCRAHAAEVVAIQAIGGPIERARRGGRARRG